MSQPQPDLFALNPRAEATRWAVLIAVLAAVAVAGIASGRLAAVTSAEVLLFGLLETFRAIGFVRRVGDELLASGEFLASLHRGGPTSGQTAGELAVFEKLLVAMEAARESGVRPDVRPLLDAICGDLYAGCGRIRLAAGVVVSLGLAGTVLGMTLTFSGVSAAVRADGDPAAVAEGMRTALDGMGGAFVTTLIGCAFGGLMLRGLSDIAERAVDRLYEQAAAQASLVRFDEDLPDEDRPGGDENDPGGDDE